MEKNKSKNTQWVWMKRRNDKDSQGGRRSNEVGWTKVSFVAWERRDDDWDKMRMRTMEAEGGRCRWQRKGEARRVDRIAEGFPHITPAPLESFSDWVTQLQHLRFSVCQVCKLIPEQNRGWKQLFKPHSLSESWRQPRFAFFKLYHCKRWGMHDVSEKAFNFSFKALQMDFLLPFN